MSAGGPGDLSLSQSAFGLLQHLLFWFSIFFISISPNFWLILLLILWWLCPYILSPSFVLDRWRVTFLEVPNISWVSLSIPTSFFFLYKGSCFLMGEFVGAQYTGPTYVHPSYLFLRYVGLSSARLLLSCGSVGTSREGRFLETMTDALPCGFIALFLLFAVEEAVLQDGVWIASLWSSALTLWVGGGFNLNVPWPLLSSNPSDLTGVLNFTSLPSFPWGDSTIYSSNDSSKDFHRDLQATGASLMPYLRGLAVFAIWSWCFGSLLERLAATPLVPHSRRTKKSSRFLIATWCSRGKGAGRGPKTSSRRRPPNRGGVFKDDWYDPYYTNGKYRWRLTRRKLHADRLSRKLREERENAANLNSLTHFCMCKTIAITLILTLLTYLGVPGSLSPSGALPGCEGSSAADSGLRKLPRKARFVAGSRRKLRRAWRVFSAPDQAKPSPGSNKEVEERVEGTIFQWVHVCGSWVRLVVVSVSLMCLLFGAYWSFLLGRHSSPSLWPVEQPMRGSWVFLLTSLALGSAVLSAGGNYWRRLHCSNYTSTTFPLLGTAGRVMSFESLSARGERLPLEPELSREDEQDTRCCPTLNLALGEKRKEDGSHGDMLSRWRRLIWAENGEAKKPGPLDADSEGYCSYYKYPAIPTPRVLTYNVRSYSAVPTSGNAKARRGRMRKNLDVALAKADIVLVQETKLQNATYYERYKRKWHVFHNPCKINVADDGTVSYAAGTDVFVRRDFAKNFRVEHVVALSSYIQYVTFRPKEESSADFPRFNRSFAVINVYISNETRAEMLHALACLSTVKHGCDYCIAGGDWNTVPDESYTVWGNTSPSAVLAAQENALAQLGLSEVVSETMTKISEHKQPQISRLDRFYVSHSVTEQKVMRPSVWLPPHPYEPGSVDSEGKKNSPSDHFPVLLAFAPDHHVGPKGSIPTWLVKLPEFRERVMAAWNDRSASADSDPWRKLKALDDIFKKTAKELTKERKFRTEGRSEAVALAMSIFRGIKSSTISLEDAQGKCRGNGLLESFADETDLDSLTIRLNKFVVRSKAHPNENGRTEKLWSTFSPTTASFLPIPRGAGKNIADAVKECPVEGRTKLDFLVDEKTGDIIRDPVKMANELKKTWEPVWGGSPSDRSLTRRYLARYRKRMTSTPGEITIEDVTRVISRPRSSCPGPDGIPFLCYAVVCVVAAPIFLEIINHLMRGKAPCQDFNWCETYFIPKDSTRHAKRTRPISASKASNRIVASIVRAKIEVPLLEILDANQSGFVPGKQTDDNIRFFNERFYSALYTRHSPHLPISGLEHKGGVGADGHYLPDSDEEGLGRDYHILFLDFAKAFDSVSREYLLSLLQQVGMPRGYLNIINALFFNVRAFPSCGAKTNVWINMVDGLKQGCPISPIFFILAIDPLLTSIASLPQLDYKCFADDLAVGSEDWRMLTTLFPVVDLWSDVSHCRTNVSKTKIVSTNSTVVRLHELVSGPWSQLETAEEYVYLGILFGVGVDVNKVYEKALNKLCARVQRFMAVQKMFHMLQRVRIANMYFIPVIGYVGRFFMLSDSVHKRVTDVLSAWTIMGSITNVQRLMAPSHSAGLAQPLRDWEKAGVASILKGKDLPPPNANMGEYSMLLSDHVLHAAEVYRDGTGVDFDKKDTQKTLASDMLHCDPEYAKRLLQTEVARVKRRGLDEDAGRSVALLVQNSLSLPDSLASDLRDHFFLLAHNCLPTFHRNRRFRDTRGCYYCGSAFDHIQHIFSECKLVSDSVTEILSLQPDFEGLDDLETVLKSGFFLRSRMTRNQLLLVLCLTKAIWEVKKIYEGGQTPSVDTASTLVASRFLVTWKYRTGRPPRNRELERSVFEEQLRALDSSAMFVYTDGSSYSSDQKSGGGFVAYETDELIACGAAPFGAGGNNRAEVLAIRLALRWVCSQSPPEKVYLFVDNRTAIRVATGWSDPDWCVHEASEIRGLLSRINTIENSEVHLFWVPGHAKVTGNEVADGLAKLGASGVRGTWSSLEEVPAPKDRPSAPDAGDEKRRNKECKRCVDVIDSVTRSRPPARKRRRRPVPTPGPARRSLRIRLLSEKRDSQEGDGAVDPSPLVEDPGSPCSWGYWSESDSDNGPEALLDEGAQGSMGAFGGLGPLDLVFSEPSQAPFSANPLRHRWEAVKGIGRAIKSTLAKLVGAFCRKLTPGFKKGKGVCSRPDPPAKLTGSAFLSLVPPETRSVALGASGPSARFRYAVYTTNAHSNSCSEFSISHNAFLPTTGDAGCLRKKKCDTADTRDAKATNLGGVPAKPVAVPLLLRACPNTFLSLAPCILSEYSTCTILIPCHDDLISSGINLSDVAAHKLITLSSPCHPFRVFGSRLQTPLPTHRCAANGGGPELCDSVVVSVADLWSSLAQGDTVEFCSLFSGIGSEAALKLSPLASPPIAPSPPPQEVRVLHLRLSFFTLLPQSVPHSFAWHDDGSIGGDFTLLPLSILSGTGLAVAPSTTHLWPFFPPSPPFDGPWSENIKSGVNCGDTDVGSLRKVIFLPSPSSADGAGSAVPLEISF